jgi:predicted RNA-binding Zn-ribbon protein involved in translation (DUF1610 family)
MEQRHFKVFYFRSNGEASHSYMEGWEKLELFCPNCGKQSVWHETGPGDYYVDESYLCTSCSHGFYLPGGVNYRGGNEQDKQRLESLTSTATPASPPPAEPTTP